MNDGISVIDTLLLLLLFLFPYGICYLNTDNRKEQKNKNDIGNKNNEN